MSETPETRTVSVIARDDGYEGFTPPLHAFATRELAEICVMGAAATYSSSLKIYELPLIGVPLPAPEPTSSTA